MTFEQLCENINTQRNDDDNVHFKSKNLEELGECRDIVKSHTNLLTQIVQDDDIFLFTANLNQKERRKLPKFHDEIHHANLFPVED